MDHGGDIDRAVALYGGVAHEWIDLSTGINRVPYSVPELHAHAWNALPTRADMAALKSAARQYYATDGDIAVLAGAQSAIQLLPQIRPRGRMRIITPTYNEYAKVFQRAGWDVQGVGDLSDLVGADVAIVVNPNNPDGRMWSVGDLRALRDQVGLLVVDESFMDVSPEHSIAGRCNDESMLVLRSFGKFFGLAGVRLGFALGGAELCTALADAVGPWPVSGAAIEIAQAAFSDDMWHRQTRVELSGLSAELDRLMPWSVVGGTSLFRLYQTPDAAAAQRMLAHHHIWTRRFPWSSAMLRIGTPSPDNMLKLQTLRLTEFPQ